ncbi:MAG: penicillin-binding protein 2 [Lentisphaeria bacterium]|nr:penicillin-binding protein 2 [Lentisphaeria bacterium]
MTGYTSIGTRVKFAFVLFFLLFAFLVWHLYGVQIVRHDELLAKARRKYTFEITRENVRGEIFDHDGNLLVGNSPVGNIAADPCEFPDNDNDEARHDAAVFLSKELGLPFTEVWKKLNDKTITVKKDGKLVTRKRRYVLLKKDIPFDQFERHCNNIQDAKIRGISYQISLKRTYPKDRMLANILGLTIIDWDKVTACSGLEKSFDRSMSSVAGKAVYERGRDGSPLVFGEITSTEGHNGNDIYMTIREPIQSILEEEIDKLMETSQATRAYMVMADPYTGSILAIAQRPTYNPNDRSTLKDGAMNNPVAELAFEPGSIMKPFAVAGALDHSIVRPDTRIDCENGSWSFAGKKLGDTHKIGVVTVSEVIKESSNIGTAKIALEIGEPRLKNILSSFGFGQRTGSPLHETRGQFYTRPSKISITRYPIGQGISVSPLQMVRAYCMLANGGYPVKLRFVDRIRNSDGTVSKIPVQSGPRIFKRDETSREIISMMKLVTQPGGTATDAAVRGYYVAGKTGTAQKIVNGRYSRAHHTASFVGIIPADHPRFVLLVTADEPKGKTHYGGAVCGPYFSRVAERTLKFMQVPPDEDYEVYDERMKIAKKREINRKVAIWAKEREERERRRNSQSTRAAEPNRIPANRPARTVKPAPRRPVQPRPANRYQRQERRYSANSRRTY